MEDYLKLAEFLFEQSTIVQVALSVLITVILAYKYIKVNEYITKRRHDTTSRVLSFAESKLKTVLNDSLSKFRQIFMTNGTISDADKTEISLLRFALSNSLLVESKAVIKSIVFINGYIAKIRNGISYDDILSSRAAEIYNINTTCLEAIIRSSSPINGHIGVLYSEAKVKDILQDLIQQHLSEVILEESDINEFIKSEIGLISKFFVYKH